MSKSPSQKYEHDVKSMFGPELPRMSKVVVEGRCVPGLYARDCNDVIEFTFSHNFSVFYEVPRSAALTFAAAIANALAIGSGYSCLGATSKDHPFAPQVIELSSEEAGKLME